jgi:hypothetical protein
MNNKTHKVIVAEYISYQYWAVPIDWNLDDCDVKYDTLYHKDDKVEGVRHEANDWKYPHGRLVEDELYDYDSFFDCEEEEEEASD